MKILDDLIAAIKVDAPLREIRQGPFQTAVWTRYCGLATTLLDEGHKHGETVVKAAGSLMAENAVELVRRAYSSSLLDASIGMAAINSLLDVDDENCAEMNGADLLAEKGAGKKVAIVGHFPFVTALREKVGELWVIEKRPRQGDYAEEAADILLPQADVVGITGSAFTNHTIENLLKSCRREAYVVVLGGTAPLSPVLFDYGVDAIAGTRVDSPEKVMACVSQGASFRQIKGIKRVMMRKDAV